MRYEVYEEHNIFHICNDACEEKEMSSEDFFNNFLESQFFLDENVDIYMYNLDLWALCFVNKFFSMGLTDMTEENLKANVMNKKVSGGFDYIYAADTNHWFCIKGCLGNYFVKIYNFDNLLKASQDDIKKNFNADDTARGMKKCIDYLESFGAKNSTISGCAYSVWRKSFDFKDFKRVFTKLDGYSESYAKYSYFGGYCDIIEGKECRVFKNGVVLDANSLYPYVMKNFRFPKGRGEFHAGEVPKHIMGDKNYTYFVNFYAVFSVKDGYIPFVRAGHDKRHPSFEILKDSTYTDLSGNKFDKYVDEYGEVKKIGVNLHLHKSEHKLFLEHYNIEEIEYFGYVLFETAGHIFDEYVDKFFELKRNASNKSEKQIAKMMLNSLSGRLGLKTEKLNSVVDKNTILSLSSAFAPKTFDVRNAKKVEHTYIKTEVQTHLRNEVFPAIAAAITAEARCYILRKAQKNYKHFIYSDTDSLHFDCGIEDLIDIKIGDGLGEFKIEHKFKKAIYYKKKVYCLQEESGDISFKYAGLPCSCQKILEAFLTSRMKEVDYVEEYRNADLFDNPFLNFGDERPHFEMEKPDYVSDLQWKKFIDSCSDMTIEDFFGLKIPYVREKIYDYKSYKKVEEIDWYLVDIWSRK